MNLAILLLAAAAIETAGIFIVRKRFKDKDVKYSKKSGTIFIVAASVMFAAIAFLFGMFANSEEWTLFSLLRTFSVICWTFFAGVVDYKLRIIPNELIVGMLIELMVIFIPEALLDMQGFRMTIVLALLGGFVMGGIFLLARAVSRGGMGMGDVKIISMCGLFLGLDNVIGMIFWALVFSIITGLILIIAKKAKMKSKIVMGPFFFGGAVVSNLMFIFSGLNGG